MLAGLGRQALLSLLALLVLLALLARVEGAGGRRPACSSSSSGALPPPQQSLQVLAEVACHEKDTALIGVDVIPHCVWLKVFMGNESDPGFLFQGIKNVGIKQVSVCLKSGVAV
jgi:hypothetical protein